MGSEVHEGGYESLGGCDAHLGEFVLEGVE